MPCNSLLILQAFSSIPAAECSSHVPSIDRHPRGRQNSIQFYSSRCSECRTRDLQNNFSCKGRLGTMRMSCNGCRVLRKGCSDSCALRPCLQWIKGSESQANATVFLAKFYGRAGLMNLINSGPEHLRPSIFRSLLYEACGRMVNPTYGSVGLLLSGKWQICQSAVESILRGSYPSRLHIIDQAVSRSPLRANKVHNIRSNVRFKRPASTRHSTLGDGDDHLDLSNATSDIRNLRWRRCHHPVRTAELPGSCSQISSDCSAESHDIGDLRNRSFQINENGRENDVDAHNGKADAKDLMGLQAEIDNRSSEVRSFKNDTCNESGIKEEIRDNHSLELELRLGFQNCYTSSNSTLPQPASYNSSRPPNSSCTGPSPFVTSLGLGLSPPA